MCSVSIILFLSEFSSAPLVKMDAEQYSFVRLIFIIKSAEGCFLNRRNFLS